MVFPSLLVRIHRTHQTERGSASPPDAGAHEVPGLQSRGQGHGSEVIVVVGSLLCVPFVDRDHACNARFLSTTLSKPFRPQKVASLSSLRPRPGAKRFPTSPSTTSPQQLGEDQF